MPRLLREAGREAEAADAAESAHRFAFDHDPWLAEEIAWDELPPPRTDEVLVGSHDLGAIRGFSLPQRDHRWTLGRAFVRLRPLSRAAAYDVTLHLGSPEPSPFASPRVKVWVEGGQATELALSREVGVFVLRTPAPAGDTLLVGLKAPTWNRTGEPAEQGIRVERVRVAPAPAR
jgi:hypothetical protein